MMESFHHRYYRLNKNLLECLGLWPYQSVCVRVIIMIVVASFGCSIFVPQVIAVLRNLDDRNLMVESAPPLIFNGLSFSKHFNFVFNSRKMLKLLNHMRMDWKAWGNDCDVNVLHEYAEEGRRITTLYIIMLATTSIVFLSQPVIPKIIDSLFKNGTQPGQFPVPVDYYYLDMQKYYFHIIVHCVVCTFVGSLTNIACDSMFIVYIQHGCGLFAILRRKLKQLGKNQLSGVSKDAPYGSNEPIMSFEYVAWCINKHNHAINYAELIDSTYAWYFLFLTAFNMILISIEGVQIIERTNELETTIKMVWCIAIAIVHLYIESYMGQILMDHSISIHNCILNSDWYVLPLKAQKLLLLMMMRCNISCKLTVAKLTFMSVKTFGVILKTSLSYFTLLRCV